MARRIGLAERLILTLLFEGRVGGKGERAEERQVPEVQRLGLQLRRGGALARLGVEFIVKKIEVAQQGIGVRLLLEDLQRVGGVSSLGVLEVEGVIAHTTELLLHILILISSINPASNDL